MSKSTLKYKKLFSLISKILGFYMRVLLYSEPALKVVHFDRSEHFGRWDRNVPSHLTKLLSPVPLFCILLTTTITKRAVTWVGSVRPECTVPSGTWNFWSFTPESLLNGKRPNAPRLIYFARWNRSKRTRTDGFFPFYSQPIQLWPEKVTNGYCNILWISCLRNIFCKNNKKYLPTWLDMKYLPTFQTRALNG